jgi:hypothetical protein
MRPDFGRKTGILRSMDHPDAWRVPHPKHNSFHAGDPYLIADDLEVVQPRQKADSGTRLHVRCVDHERPGVSRRRTKKNYSFTGKKNAR